MKKFIVIFIPFIVAVSCGKNQKKIDDPETRTQATARNSFFAYLKNPREITKAIAPGISFNESLLHDPSHFIDYAGNDVKAAANMGIYLSDLNYCILNKQSAHSKAYFNASYELSKVLLMEKRTLEFLMKRYEENINQNDSVKLVMEQLLSESTLGLQGTDRQRLAGIAMAGYQVENLHLALSTLESFPENTTVEQIQTKTLLLGFVISQREKFVVIYNFVQANSDPLDPDRNPNYPYYDQALRELLDVYQGVTENSPRVTELHEKISSIRNKMILVE